MKYLILIIFSLLTISLFSTNYTGEWKINTMGSGNKATISQNKNEISIFRIIKQEFEGEKYILYHLMKGNLKDNKLKLYVKEDELEKFEFLRDVSFKKEDLNTLKIDGKTYVKIQKNTKLLSQKKPSKKTDGKIEIIYLKKPKEDKNIANNNEPSIMLPAGLGEKGNKQIKISIGFNDNEKTLNMKAIRLLKRKHYKKAINIFLNLYKNNNKNISILIKLENTYSMMGDVKEAKKYCKKIKRYDPFYLCGG